MHRVASRITQVSQTCHSMGFHSSASRAAISRFNLPAMSPTMTEGTIHKWKLKEGDSFVAGDVLLELETDKAQIDVEASEDGILAKIILQDGSKAPVNTLIGLLAEEGDDISSVEIPASAPTASADTAAAADAAAEKPVEKKVEAPVASISHKDLDTSKLKKPLSPAVYSLVLKYGIKDVDSIKASGNGGRILKGDVLAHLGLIKPKPAPKATLSIAPPRDQIVFAKTEKVQEKKKKEEVLPSFISKEMMVDNLLGLRHTMNEQNGTHVSVNDFIAKAAQRALQDVVANKSGNVKNPIVYSTTAASFSEKYTGGQFKVFNLAEPTYDFITDSYQTSKPYVLSVGSHSTQQKKETKKNDEMMDLISYLGGESPKKQQERKITLSSQVKPLNFTPIPTTVQVKLEGGAPGHILKEQKANAFLHRVEHYIRNPNELVV